MSVANPIARQDTLLTARDLSAQLGWAEGTIYRKRSLGHSLPKALKIGGALRWRQRDVDAWLDEQVEEA